MGKLRKIEPIVISQTKSGQIRVCISEFKGKHYVDVRNYYLSDDGSYKPTPKGCAVPLESIKKLGVSLKQLYREAVESGLLEEK